MKSCDSKKRLHYGTRNDRAHMEVMWSYASMSTGVRACLKEAGDPRNVDYRKVE